MVSPVCNDICLTMDFDSNTLVTVTKRGADGRTVYNYVFEDKGRKIMVKFDILGRSRYEPALPSEPESQLESPSERHNETQTELGLECEEQSKSQSAPSSKAQPKLEGILQHMPQPETQLEPNSLHEELNNAAKEAVKVESVRDRLGVSVTFLEGLLKIGDMAKDVSR